MKDSVAIAEATALESQRLLALYEARTSVSQKEFGAESKLGSASMVWQYLHGRRSLSLKAALRFARSLGVDLSDFSPRLAHEYEEIVLAGGLSQRTGSDPQYESIPCVNLLLKAGSNRVEFKSVAEPPAVASFRREWLVEHDYDRRKLFAVRCEDDGMRPTIGRNDLVVVNAGDGKPSDTCVYAVNYEGNLRIRRMFRDAGHWWLHCDNVEVQRFPRKQFFDKHCFVIGKVIHRFGQNV